MATTRKHYAPVLASRLKQAGEVMSGRFDGWQPAAVESGVKMVPVADEHHQKYRGAHGPSGDTLLFVLNLWTPCRPCGGVHPTHVTDRCRHDSWPLRRVHGPRRWGNRRRWRVTGRPRGAAIAAKSPRVRACPARLVILGRRACSSIFEARTAGRVGWQRLAEAGNIEVNGRFGGLITQRSQVQSCPGN